MSMTLCQDCRSFCGEIGECPICGWKGIPLRKILNQRMADDIWKDMKEELKLKKEGKLCFVRVYLDFGFDSEVVEKVAEILGEDKHRPEGRVQLFRMSRKPSDAEIKEIEALEDVKKVTVF